MKEENLIFIASQPRAGSTYLQNVLSNNLVTNTVSEPWVMLALAPLIKPSLVSRARYDHKLAIDAFSDYQEKVGIIMKNEIKLLAEKCYAPLFDGYTHVIDKTPRYWEILDDLIELFPKARIIVLKRNPIDVVKSIIQTWDVKTLDHLNSYRRDLLVAPLAIDTFLERNNSNPNVIGTYYRDLMNNELDSTKVMYNELGLPFNEKVMDTSKNIKYKGKYGDPYQNNQEKQKRNLEKPFQDFILGYSEFLGNDFFSKHDFTLSKQKKTNAFNYFLNLGGYGEFNGINGLKRELSLNYKRFLINYKK